MTAVFISSQINPAEGKTQQLYSSEQRNKRLEIAMSQAIGLE